MARISARRISPKLQNQMFYLFWKNLADLKKPRDLEFLTTDLFSPVERLMIAKRFMIAVLLRMGQSFRKICSTLKVSPNTVNSVAHRLRRKNSPYLSLVKKFLSGGKVKKLVGPFS